MRRPVVDAIGAQVHGSGHDHGRQRLASPAAADPPGAERGASAQRPDRVDDSGDVSASQGGVSAGLRADRPDHARLPGDLVAAAAAAGLRHGPQAVAVRDGCGHGGYPDGGDRTRMRKQLRDGAGLGGTRRARLGRVPSGSHAHGAPCGGRPAGLRAGRLPDRRTCRIRHRAADRRHDGGAARADEHRLGVGGGADCHGAHVVDRRALRADAQLAGRGREGASGSTGQGQPAGRPHTDGDDRSHRPAAVEERLHGGIHVLLHVLPDRAVRRDGAGLAGPAVPLPGGGRGRRRHRRHGGRSRRPPPRHLDLDPGLAALRAPAAVRRACSGRRCSAS